jgi:hypothetical protein
MMTVPLPSGPHHDMQGCVATTMDKGGGGEYPIRVGAQLLLPQSGRGYSPYVVMRIAGAANSFQPVCSTSIWLL